MVTERICQARSLSGEVSRFYPPKTRRVALPLTCRCRFPGTAQRTKVLTFDQVLTPGSGLLDEVVSTVLATLAPPHEGGAVAEGMNVRTFEKSRGHQVHWPRPVRRKQAHRKAANR